MHAEEQRLQPDHEQRRARAASSRRERDRPDRVAEASAETSRSSPRSSITMPGLDEEEVGAVDEHRAQVDPRGLERENQPSACGG